MKKILLAPLKVLYPLIFIVLFLGYKGFIYQDIKAYIIRIFSNNSIGPNIDTVFMSLEIVLMLLIYKKLPSSIKNGYGIRKISIKDIILIFFFTMSVYIVVEKAKGYQYSIKYNKQGIYDTMENIFGEKIDISNIYSYANGDNFINTIVLSSILEELVYRYFMNIPYKSKIGKVYGLICSSFLFALSHGIGRSIFWSALVDGVISCIIFYYSKNILTSISLHISSNILSTLFLIISVKFTIIREFIIDNKLEFITIEFPIIITVILIAIGFFAGLLFFKTYTKKELLI